MVIPRLVQQALREEPLTVFGDGRQTRCFAHVTDVVDAILRLFDEPAAIGQTFNIGSSEETSILRLAELIIARCEGRSQVELLPYDQAYGPGFEDMRRRVPDTTKLRDLTGWVPRHSLDDVLTDAIAQARHDLDLHPEPVSA
jgi:UDP-glucose 4-epimerase